MEEISLTGGRAGGSFAVKIANAKGWQKLGHELDKYTNKFNLLVEDNDLLKQNL